MSVQDKTIIETPRLILREFNSGDAAAVLRFNSDADVTKYTGDKGQMETVADALKVINDVWIRGYRHDGYARLAAVDKASGEVIGFCGLKYLPEYQMADVGYRFLPQYWGKGLGYEGAQAVMDYGFKQLKLDNIMGMALADNVASAKILLKVGLKAAGQIVDQGVEVDLFRVSQQEYLAGQ